MLRGRGRIALKALVIKEPCRLSAAWQACWCALASHIPSLHAPLPPHPPLPQPAPEDLDGLRLALNRSQRHNLKLSSKLAKARDEAAAKLAQGSEEEHSGCAVVCMQAARSPPQLLYLQLSLAHRAATNWHSLRGYAGYTCFTLLCCACSPQGGRGAALGGGSGAAGGAAGGAASAAGGRAAAAL